LEEEKMSLY